MHIRSQLLGDKCSTGFCGSLSCPEDTMEELRIVVDDKAESPRKRKQEEKTDGGVIKASSKTNCENGTDNRLRMKGKEKMTAVEQVSTGNGLLFQAKAVCLVNFFSVSPLHLYPLLPNFLSLSILPLLANLSRCCFRYQKKTESRLTFQNQKPIIVHRKEVMHH
jgi:hypothetical protein